MNQKKRDQVVNLVNKLTEARAEVTRIEGELDGLLMPGTVDQEPVVTTPRQRRKSTPVPEPIVETKPAGERTGYDRLVAAINKKGAGHTWTPQALAKASKVKPNSVYALINRAIQERVLNKSSFGQYDSVQLS